MLASLRKMPKCSLVTRRRYNSTKNSMFFLYRTTHEDFFVVTELRIINYSMWSNYQAFVAIYISNILIEHSIYTRYHHGIVYEMGMDSFSLSRSLSPSYSYSALLILVDWNDRVNKVYAGARKLSNSFKWLRHENVIDFDLSQYCVSVANKCSRHTCTLSNVYIMFEK